jgi:hypothetical protein
VLIGILIAVIKTAVNRLSIPETIILLDFKLKIFLKGVIE